MLETSERRRSTYLSRLYMPPHEEDYRYRNVNLVVRIVFPAKAIKSLTVLQARIVKLSEFGAVIQSSNLRKIPDHFYICVGNFEIFLTCAQLRANKDNLVVRFSKVEESSFIDALSLIPFPLDTMHKLKGKYGKTIAVRCHSHVEEDGVSV